jgi:hypothetical protein
MRAFTKFLGTAAAAAFVGLATPALAAHDLPPGDTNSPIVNNLSNIGVLLADTGLQNISMTQFGTTLDATFRSAVYSHATDPTLLNFLYQVSSSQNSNTSVEELTFASFSGWTITGVWQQLGAFGVFGAGVEGADSAQRGSLFGGQVVSLRFDTVGVSGDADFGISPLLDPGETSSILQIQVRAPSYRGGTFTAQDGIAVTARGFAPAVPEPTTWALMILGFGSAGAMLRRRRQVALAA